LKESVSNKQIQDWLLSEGAYVFKTVATNRSGTHDIIACLDGKFVSIEGKIKGGVSSALQEAVCHRVWEAGGLAIIAFSLRDVQMAISAWRANGYTWSEPVKIRESLRFTL